MTAIFRRLGPPSLSQQLRAAPGMTRRLMFEVIDKACQRVRLPGHSERTGRLMRLIDGGAWTDAALALMELELPLWQVRRLAYDAGEWHCALSRQRELPDWLDAAVEAHHADLTLAMLSTFVEVRAWATELPGSSVPSVRPMLDPLCQPVACGNFG